MSHAHHSSRRRVYGRRRHQLHERATRADRRDRARRRSWSIEEAGEVSSGVASAAVGFPAPVAYLAADRPAER